MIEALNQPPGFENPKFPNRVYKTLFLMRSGTDFLLVQIYVDDIIFGGSSHALASKFSEQMSRDFEMSMMGELQFFLGRRSSKLLRARSSIKPSTPGTCYGSST